MDKTTTPYNFTPVDKNTLTIDLVGAVKSLVRVYENPWQDVGTPHTEQLQNAIENIARFTNIIEKNQSVLDNPLNQQNPKYANRIKLVGEHGKEGRIYNLDMGVLEEHYNTIIGGDGVDFVRNAIELGGVSITGGAISGVPTTYDYLGKELEDILLPS